MSGCACGNGFNCVCQWVKDHPGETEYYCIFCGEYAASKPHCNRCRQEESRQEESRQDKQDDKQDRMVKANHVIEKRLSDLEKKNPDGVFTGEDGHQLQLLISAKNKLKEAATIINHYLSKT